MNYPKVSVQAAWLVLFRTYIDESTLVEIRHVAQKGWILGYYRFKDEIEYLDQVVLAPCFQGGALYKC